MTASSLALLAVVLIVIGMPAGRAWTAEAGGPGGETTLASAVASLQQEEPPVAVTPLVSAQIEQLPNEPLRWVVREFRHPAGFTTPLLSHPPNLVYVLEGVTSLTQEGLTISLGPGSGGFDMGVSHVHATAGNVPARLLNFYLYPLSQPSPPDTAVGIMLFESEPLEGLRGGPYTLALSLVEARQGVAGPAHYHPGPTLGYLLEGALEHTLGGVYTTRRSGDAWLEQPGVTSSGRFSGSMAVKLLVAQVLPQGAPLLIPVD